MGKRKATDKKIVEERLANDLKVLRYLLKSIKSLAVGKSTRSAEKLTVYYAGYTAMRSIWDVKTHGGRESTGNKEFDDEVNNSEGKFIFRVNMEITHSIGLASETLFLVQKFKYWAKRILRQWG